MSEQEGTESPDARTRVLRAALDLFATCGFEATSVDQIAQAVGISRSTFFRQYGGKDDVIFADQAALLVGLEDELNATGGSPWRAVTTASVRVFTLSTADPELARKRYRVVRGVAALRNREVTGQAAFTRCFSKFLLSRLPDLDALDADMFSAAATAAHSRVLRCLVRDEPGGTVTDLDEANERLLFRFSVADTSPVAQPDDVVIAAFPRAMPPAEVARRVLIGLAQQSTGGTASPKEHI